MSGTALLECVAVLFIAQAYGVELSAWQQFLVVCTSLLCAVGAAGIPMAALVMLTMILQVVNLPLEGIGLVIGVDRLLDMMRTAVNVYGDTCVAVMVAKSEGENLSV
jgi:Na+/H+-dicarboxylate symporter